LSVAADSSFLVSYYVFDTHSERAAEWAEKQSAEMILTSLTVMEIDNALQARVFRGQNTADESRKAIAAFEADLANGAFRQMPLPESIWITARNLTRSHTSVIGARSLDILHVASALALKADTFLTFDERQARLARAVGLATPMDV